VRQRGDILAVERRDKGVCELHHDLLHVRVTVVLGRTHLIKLSLLDGIVIRIVIGGFVPYG
jgi:hypothetical protein